MLPLVVGDLSTILARNTDVIAWALGAFLVVTFSRWVLKNR